MAKRRKSIQVVVEDILAAAKAYPAYVEAVHTHTAFAVKVENAPYQDLHIEVTPLGEVAVAHTYYEDGEVWYDPEIVFTPVSWNAVEITQSPTGYYQRAPQGMYLPGANELAKVLARNLRLQGFTNANSAKYIVKGDNLNEEETVT